MLRSPSYADVGQVRLAEGGCPAAGVEAEQPWDAAGSWGKRKWTREVREERWPWWRREDGASPLVRRWLQVECEAGTAHLAFAELPATRPVEASDVLARQRRQHGHRGRLRPAAGGIPRGEFNVLMLPQA
ncbi:hypothetical protein [Streptomyces sp. NPDC047990]|uniref:hypothetical protein n=1 Tax=Streptomyces sp. NPDC047990 TaxID=3365496 RepID=UPI0037196190